MRRSGRIRLLSLIAVALVAVAATGLMPARANVANPHWDEWDFLNLMNRERRVSGMAPLAMLGGLRDVARGWSRDMASRNKLEHNPNMQSQIQAIYPDWLGISENVGVGSDVSRLHDAFMASPGHKANILRDRNYVGVGVVWSSTGQLWVTVNFLRSGSQPWFTRTPVTRLMGGSPVDASVLVSRLRPAGSASSVVVARQDVFADALAGGPLASVRNGPVLLTPSTSVPSNLLTEARRVLRAGGTAILLGGPSALTVEVDRAFLGAGIPVERVAGTDRFATAAAIAPRVSASPSTVFLASGINFPDAVVAGAAGGALGAPILLVEPGSVPASTSAYLSATRPPTRVVVGGVAVVPDAVARAGGMTERVAGADRYATSVAVARRFFPSANRIALATGTAFTDALSASPEAARRRMPVILSAPTPSGPTYDYVARQVAKWSEAVLVGTPSVIPDNTVILLFS